MNRMDRMKEVTESIEANVSHRSLCDESILNVLFILSSVCLGCGMASVG
jgi:hypothetical protein